MYFKRNVCRGYVKNHENLKDIQIKLILFLYYEISRSFPIRPCVLEIV